MNPDAVNVLDEMIESLRSKLVELENPDALPGDKPVFAALAEDIRARLQEWLDLQTALAQAVELAIHVDRSAKGSLAEEAARVLSTPYAAALRARLADHRPWTLCTVTEPPGLGMYEATVATDDGPEVLVLRYTGNHWEYEGEPTFAHAFYVEVMAWRTRAEPIPFAPATD